MIPTRANQTVLCDSRILGFNPRTGSILAIKIKAHNAGIVTHMLYKYRYPYLSEALRFNREISYFLKGQTELLVLDRVNTGSFGVFDLLTNTLNFNLTDVKIKWFVVVEISARRLEKM